MGQNFAFSMLKSTPARKKYAASGCVVGTNITYDRSQFLIFHQMLFFDVKHSWAGSDD